MNDTIVITSIYGEFWGTKEFRKSVEKVGLPLHNAWKGKRFTGNGDVIRYIYEALKELEGKYKYAIYSDGADSYFIKSFIPPDDIIIYSAEKAMWPPKPILEYPKPKTVWRYLNGGGYCGEIKLLIEFFEKYGLDKLKGDINGQLQQAQAYLQALKDGFPIKLDEQCEYFQTTGFAEERELIIMDIMEGKDVERILKNTITKTYPAIAHGNGRTDMEWIYKPFNIFNNGSTRNT